MLRGIGLALAWVCLALGPAGAGAQEGVPAVTPFRPALRLDTEAEICRAFAGAWQLVFDNPKVLTETYLDLEAAFPRAEVFSFPPEPRNPDWYGGLYETSWVLVADLHDAGPRELLHIQGTSIGWRYMAVDIYGFRSENAYRDAKAVFVPRTPRSDFLFSRFPIFSGDSTPTVRPLLQLRPSDVAFVFRQSGVTYVTAAPEYDWRGGQTTAILYRLDGVAAAREVCRLQLLPDYASFDSFMQTSELFQALTRVYGGSNGRCMGTMGWTAPDMRSHLQTLFHRPQAMKGKVSPPGRDPARDDAARELRLMSWALGDPSSWAVYERFKQGYGAFMEGMAAYYLTHFVNSEAEARNLAEQAYRFFVDGIVYGRQGEGQLLTWIAWNAQPLLDIDASDTPAAIIDAALAAWSALPDTRIVESYRALPDSWERLALAAAHTRRPPAVVEELWQHAVSAAETFEATLDKAALRNGFAELRQKARDQLLLASLGDPSLIELALSFGARVDAPTNVFQKTPLMYTAQVNELASARLLLAHGADPSARTQSRDPDCRPLERDHRTPLMYAAENAEPALIDLLLVSGADPAMVDTQGNDVLWYLDRNEALDAGEKATLRERLTHR